VLIDWFTVGAQALNFVVLVWLLKRFLYRPVLDAIAAREDRIAQQIADADATKRGAEEQREVLIQKHEAFDRERTALLEQAVQEAQAERERLVTAAREAADQLIAKRREALRSEAAQLHSTLADSARHEVFEITRRVLADLATASLEERLANVLIRRLRELDGPGKSKFAAAFSAPGASAVVHSAFELPDAQRLLIQSAVRNCLDLDIAMQFVTAPDLVNGIELIGAGQKLAWSIDQYLDALEDTAADLMDQATESTVSTSRSAIGTLPKPSTSGA
jgi:F-type H+-transporting ATPase subunit b